MSESPTFWTQRDILERGWTAGQIQKWLGAPDELRANPHHVRGGDVCLYARERVLTCEFDQAWRRQMDEIEKVRGVRKEAASRAARTRKERAEALLREGPKIIGFND